MGMSNSVELQKPFSVLLADDQSEWRQRLKDQLEKNFPHLARPIYEVSHPDQAISTAKERKPDLIFTDIQFDEEDTDLNGINIAARIWEALPEANIIIVSSYTSQDHVHELYEVMPESASYGWLVKARLVRDLPVVTRAVLDGDCWVDSDVERIEGRLKGEDRLDKKLHETLAYVALGYSQKAIAALLKISAKAVEKRLEELYVQLGLPMKNAEKDEIGAGLINHRCRAVWMGFELNYLTESELRSIKLSLPDDEELRELMIRHEVASKPEIRNAAKAIFEHFNKQSAEKSKNKKDDLQALIQDAIARVIIDRQLSGRDYLLQLNIKAELLEVFESLRLFKEICTDTLCLTVRPGEAHLHE
jgi:DNA-binding NarL/FixJ family response regulator